MNKINILIVGASGKLGHLVTHHCLSRPNLQVNILLRNPSKDRDLALEVQKTGGKIFTGDLTYPESLQEATKGMHTVICLINSTDEKVAVDGQISLVKACIANGVQRFVPSDFGVNYTQFTKEELNRTAIVHPKIKFQEFLSTTSIKLLRFWQGILMEMFIQLQAQGFGYWGDNKFKMDLTCYDDIARVVATAVSNPDLTGNFTFVGDSLDFNDIAQIYNKVRGTHIKPQRMGSIEDLKELYFEKRKQGEFYAEILGLLLLTSDERSTFKKNNNSDFSEVNPTSFVEFLQRNPDQKLPGA